MDVHSPEKRSFNISKIKGKDTKPEMLLRKWLWGNVYRYRLHGKNLPGKPDIIFSGIGSVIFVHGCFWHKHSYKYFQWPATRRDFWKKKLHGNAVRDKENYQKLSSLGWRYLIVWECEFKSGDTNKLWRKVAKFLS